MKILHLSSELASIAKVGGLGDAVFGLAHAQALQGHQVSLIMPYYQSATVSHLFDLHVAYNDLWFSFDASRFGARIWQSDYNDIDLLLVEILHPHNFFQREQVYGYDDDSARFLAFLRAVASMLEKNCDFDVVHLHDWPTAALPCLLPMQKKWPKLVLSLHNIEHQGFVDATTAQRAQINRLLGARSMLEMGIRTCDALSAVSKRYLEEIQTPEGGRGLDSLIKQRVQEIPTAGIVNGIDEDYWNPSSSVIDNGFCANSLTFSPTQAQCEAKRISKHRLQKELALDVCDAPLVVCITRLVPQKGLDLIEHGLYRTLEKGGQFVLLGTSPIPAIQRHFQRLEQHLQHSSKARLLLTYSENHALKIFSAADLVLIPSLFEPCGLTQLIGFRFGALAIARETGGLKDTVIDLNHHPLSKSHGNGFSFEYPDFKGIGYALDRALLAWHQQPKEWQQWVQRVCKIDVSWAKPAESYLKLYEKALSAHSHIL